jgi:hypothetical protein
MMMMMMMMAAVATLCEVIEESFAFNSYAIITVVSDSLC